MAVDSAPHRYAAMNFTAGPRTRPCRLEQKDCSANIDLLYIVFVPPSAIDPFNNAIYRK